jgi:CBS domain-containing membrane protein
MNGFKFLGIELVDVSLAEKLISTLGGGLSILMLTGVCLLALPYSGAALVIASMGASAVLLFAVPHGPLSQPWPVIAGHGISAVIGVTCARYIPQPHFAAACAVGLAIGAMYQFKCIHPPGGATAFTAVMGGTSVQHLGFGFVLFPVLTNAIVMVLLAVVINYAFKWRRYPASFNVPSHPMRPLQSGYTPPSHDEVVAAIKSLDSFVDISEEDLLRLTERLSQGTQILREHKERANHEANI